MAQSTPGYGRAVASLIIGIVSIPLLWMCGLGIVTAIAGLVLAVSAQRRAAQAPGAGRGLATAGIVVNGVVVALAAVLAAMMGLVAMGRLVTQ